jgi:3-methyladenine DNA glycosylase AlkD
MNDVDSILALLRENATPASLAGMSRFGIDTSTALGVRVPVLRKLAREIRKDHQLALRLWGTGVHEARILASMIDVPSEVTQKQIRDWTADFNSWDVCDQVCGNLFDKTPFAVACAKKFCRHKEELVKRAGFVLMAEMAVHDKKAPDEVFLEFLPLIEEEAWDGRNFVKKAVNWALRQIGKRNKRLLKPAIAAAERIARQDSRSAKWIARDALRELEKKGQACG